jgi:hypothetical protein
MVKPCHGWKKLERIEEKKERWRRESKEKGDQFSPNPTLEREREKDYEVIWPQNN